MTVAAQGGADASRRRLLVAAGLAVVPAWGAARDKPLNLVSLRDFQPGAGSDWTAALNQACALARRVYIPPGEYAIRGARWPADTEIFGDGECSILRMPEDAPYLLTNDSGSPLVRHNIAGLSMHDLQLRGGCDLAGMSEFRHLVSLNGVSDVRFQDVLFRGFRGDALYLGSGNRGDAARHNTAVAVRRCRFDGINRQNRNGISVIDCDGLLVEDCEFTRLTRHDMPGAIDIEPNRNPYHVVRDIAIRRNRFRGVGGNVGVISVYVQPVTAIPQDIVVEDNLSEAYLGSGSFFHYNDNRLPAAGSRQVGIRVAGNAARGGASAFVLHAGSGILLEANRFRDFLRPSRIGYAAPGMLVRGVRLEGNVMLRCGSAGQCAVAVYQADDLQFLCNRFIESGSAAASAASAVLFERGRSSHVVFEGNVFRSSRPRALFAIRKDPSHVLTPQSNRFAGNRLHGLVSFFQAGP